MNEKLLDLKERTLSFVFLMETSLDVIVILSTLAIGINIMNLVQNYENSFIHNTILVMSIMLLIGIFSFYYVKRSLKKDIEGFFDKTIATLEKEHTNEQ